MRVLVFGDVHLAERPPNARVISYVEDIFAKLEEVKEIAADADISIMLGDMFHKHSVPHGLVRRLIAFLRDWPCPLYIVVGNHDLPADGMAGLERTALGVVLEAFSDTDVQLLREDVLIKSPRDVEDESIARAGSGTPRGGPRDPYVQLSPGHWTPTIDGDASALMMGREISPSWRKVLIKAMHSMIVTDGADHPFTCVRADDVSTDAHIVLVGHCHWATGPYTNKDGTLFVGPGSITRTQNSERERARQIQVAVLTLAKDKPVEVEMIPLRSARPASEVFSDKVEDKTQERDERLSGYVATLESGLMLGGDSVEGALEMMRGKAPHGVSELAMEYLTAAGL